MTIDPDALPRAQWSALAVSGADAVAFVQGQCTQDLRTLDAERLALGGFANQQGRVIALARIVQRDGDLLLLVPDGLVEPLLERLRKYVLRSKVVLRDARAELACRRWTAGDDAVARALGAVPDVPHARLDDGTSLVRLRGRGLLVGAPTAVARHAADLPPEADDAAWLAAAIAAGEPEVLPGSSEQWLPQMLNLDLLDGISFTKGCYTGQEIVARTQHLGRIKRRTFRYGGPGAAPAPGAALLDAGAKVGEVVIAAPAGGGCECLAVVALDARDRSLALADGRVLEPRPLPYAVA